MWLRVGHTSLGAVMVVEVCIHSEWDSLDLDHTHTAVQGAWSDRADIDKESCRRGQGEGHGRSTEETWSRSWPGMVHGEGEEG